MSSGPPYMQKSPLENHLIFIKWLKYVSGQIVLKPQPSKKQSEILFTAGIKTHLWPSDHSGQH